MTAVSQPAGQVTLVFSDIEGSTKLLEELGTEVYRNALAEHRRIIRAAYHRYAGPASMPPSTSGWTSTSRRA